MALVVLIKCPDGSIIDVPMFGPIVIIGRSSKSDIKIEDPMISSKHCSIELKNNTLIFKDLGSTNGSYLYNSQISSVQIRCGDQVRIGNTYIYLDESKLSPKEKITHSHSAGKTQIMYVKMKEQGGNEDEDEDESSHHGPTFSDIEDNDEDVVSRLEAREKEAQKQVGANVAEKPISEAAKRRVSVGSNLAKKVLDNKKTAVSTVALNTKETNFEQEAASGKTQFIKLEKKKPEEGPIHKRHGSKRKIDGSSEEKSEGKSDGIMGMIKKILGK